MFIVHNISELLRHYDEINDPQNLMLQSYIPGPEENCWIFHAYFNSRSECLASFTGRKLRQCRAYAGATSLGICTQCDIITQNCIRFLKAINYSGPVDICLRYDFRDDLYKVLDVNPRLGANFRLFVSPAGVDLARMYYLNMTGQACPFDAVRQGRKWIVEDFDCVSSVRYWSDGNLSIRQWWSSLRGIEERAYLSVRDPLPVTARLLENALEAVKRVRASLRFSFRHSRKLPDQSCAAVNATLHH